MVGGGSLLKKIDRIISQETKIPVKIAEDPFTAVVRGCGLILDDLDRLKNVLLEDEDEIAPR